MRDPLYTIGHSNRSAALFHRMLAAHGIERLIDVRAMPRSRFNPQFNHQALSTMLSAHGIGYVHMPELGGKRPPSAHSPNGWFRREGGLQSYADYMGTDAFREALDQLLARAEGHRVAIMCAEATPEACHRQLIADALVVRGWPVIHLVTPESARPHQRHTAAVIDALGRLTYPPHQPEMDLG